MSHLDGVAGDLEIQVVGEQRVELNAQQPALGHAAAPLLHNKAEILFQIFVHDDNGFAEQGAHLGATDVEHIAQPRDLWQRHVALLCHQAIAQPCAVNEQRQAVPAAGVIQRRQLRLGIQRASLSGVGDVHHTGLDDVLRGLIVSVPLHIVLHLLRSDLAVGGGQGDDLMARGLDGTGLMAVDVTADGGNHALPGPQDGGDDGGVGLGAAHQKMHVGLRGLAGGLDLLTRRLTVLVLAVAHSLDHICLVELLHHIGMGTLQIVAVEIDHGSFSFIFILSPSYPSGVHL